MRRGVDTNVLIYAHMPESPHHARVRSFLLDQLSRDDVILVITPVILHELVHIVTDGRRFLPPLSMSDALALARVYLEHANVECIRLDVAAVASAFELIERHQLGRKRIADTLFAASLLGNGVHELITCNPGDFQIFEGLTLLDPRSLSEPS
jgi:predicted nucleic acid-binding protein